MSTPYPFVNDLVFRTDKINNSPQIICGSDDPCTITSILLVNTSKNTISVSLYVLTEISMDVTKQTPVSNQIIIPPNQMIEGLPVSILNLAAGELLYAYSDYSSNFFAANVSYRTYSPPPT